VNLREKKYKTRAKEKAQITIALDVIFGLVSPKLIFSQNCPNVIAPLSRKDAMWLN